MNAETLEIEGKSIDDAIEKACREFGVAREKLNIEIISEDSGGFLGILSKKAKIRASLLSLDMDFAFTDHPQAKSESRIKIETPEKIVLNIEGNDTGLLIGKRGQNLDALQYILNKALNKSDNQRKMIMVDAEEYRKRREESLLSLAERKRQKVKKTRKAVSLGHMSAHDRRIIHLALQEDSSLTTKSRGEGEYRKIIILPAKKGNSGRNAEKTQS